ncbi:hypothetical protein ACOJUR_02390 [Alicyclobacillus tolerans]|uniref:hypothetical protein n=1 Tax=Alicyclobacillus tolerans TaxID=90970 RepID=UPI003B7DBADA
MFLDTALFLHEEMVELNFLLTILATTGALGRIAFALLYGWYTSREIPCYPNNVQSMADLAALFASVREYHAAMRWIREVLQHQPALWKDFDTDSRLIRLRETHPKEWAELLAPAKKHTQNL